MVLHPAVLRDLLDLEVEVARTRLGSRAGDLHRDGDALVMTLVRPDGSWRLQLDGRGYDAEPFDLALTDDDGAVLSLERWIPGLAQGIHPVLQAPWACISGTRGYYCYPGHHQDRWDTARFQLRADSLLDTVLRKVSL
jgi:hypothetical protein